MLNNDSTSQTEENPWINFSFNILSKHGQWNINRRIFKNLDIKPGHSSSRVVFI